MRSPHTSDPASPFDFAQGRPAGTPRQARDGLTLVELLVALAVSGVILGAVATLAYAMGRASDGSDEVARSQAEVRYATARLTELIRNCRLVCWAGSNEFSLWRADDNGDDQINIGELVYVDKGAAGDYLRLWQFTAASGSAIELSSIGALSTNWWSTYASAASDTVLVPQCSDVEFGFDVLPAGSELVRISFSKLENGINRQFEVCARLRARAANLLNEAGESIVSDDD